MFSSLTNTASPISETQEAEIIKVMRPNKEWRIKYQGTYWTARSETLIPFEVGDRVKVLGHPTDGDRVSTILLIERL